MTSVKKRANDTKKRPPCQWEIYLPKDSRMKTPFNWSRQRDSNPRPAVYKTAALPLRYTGMKKRVKYTITPP